MNTTENHTMWKPTYEELDAAYEAREIGKEERDQGYRWLDVAGARALALREFRANDPDWSKRTPQEQDELVMAKRGVLWEDRQDELKAFRLGVTRPDRPTTVEAVEDAYLDGRITGPERDEIIRLTERQTEKSRAMVERMREDIEGGFWGKDVPWDELPPGKTVVPEPIPIHDTSAPPEFTRLPLVSPHAWSGERSFDEILPGMTRLAQEDFLLRAARLDPADPDFKSDLRELKGKCIVRAYAQEVARMTQEAALARAQGDVPDAEPEVPGVVAGPMYASALDGDVPDVGHDSGGMGMTDAGEAGGWDDGALRVAALPELEVTGEKPPVVKSGDANVSKNNDSTLKPILQYIEKRLNPDSHGSDFYGKYPLELFEKHVAVFEDDMEKLKREGASDILGEARMRVEKMQETMQEYVIKQGARLEQRFITKRFE